MLGSAMKKMREVGKCFWITKGRVAAVSVLTAITCACATHSCAYIIVGATKSCACLREKIDAHLRVAHCKINP